jgi:O-antigen/teichoic acid export membrane protein
LALEKQDSQAGQRGWFGNSAIIFVARSFSTLANLAITIFFAHQLHLEDNGQYQNFWIRLTVLGTIASLGLAALAYTYAPSTIKTILQQLRKRHYAIFVAVLGLMSLIFYTFFRLDDSSAPYESPASPVLIPFFALFVCNIILEALLTVYRRFAVLLCTAVAYGAGFVIAHAQMLSGFDLNRLFLYLTILNVIKFIVYFQTVRTAVHRADVKEARPVHILRVRGMWMHVFIYDATQIIFRFLDKFVISFLFSRDISALYIAGTLEIPFLPTVFTAVSSSALMHLSKSKNISNMDAAAVIRSSSMVLATITFPVFCYLFFFRYEFITFIFSDKYAASVPIFACALIRLPYFVLNVPFYLQFRQRGDLMNRGAALDIILTLALSLPMYYVLGLQGIVLSFVISSYVQLFYYTYCTSKLLELSPLRFFPLLNWAVKALVFSMLAIIMHHLLKAHCSPAVTVIAGGLSMVAAGFLWLMLETKKKGIITFGRN